MGIRALTKLCSLVSKSTIPNGSAGEQVFYFYGDILEDQKDHSYPHQSTDMVLTVHFD